MPIATIATGRTRRLKSTVTGSYQHTVNTTPLMPPDGDPSATGAVQVTAPWGDGSEYATAGSALNGKHKGTVINVCDGWNAPISQDNSFAVGGSPVIFSETIDYSTTLYIDVAEYLVVDFLYNFDPTAVTNINGTNFPNFGGTAQGDDQPAIYCYFVELGQAGGSAYASVVDNYGSLASTYTLAGGETIPSGYLMAYQAECSAGNASATTTGTDTTWNGLIDPTYTYNYSDSISSLAISASGATFSIACSGSPIGGSAATLQAVCAPPTLYSSNLRGRAFNSALTLPMRLQDKRRLSGGTYNISNIFVNTDYSSTWSQLTYNVTGTYTITTGSGSLPSATVAETCPIRIWVDPTVSSSGDDARDWRCLIRGKPYPSFTLEQTNSLTVGSAQTTSGSVSLGVTKWEGYRYLQFLADQSRSLTITNSQGQTKTYSWTVTTPGTAQTITIDLASPASWSVEALPAVDGRQSRYPLITPASSAVGTYPDEVNPSNQNKGVYAGIFEVASATISGGSVDLGTLNLIRGLNAYASFLPGFLPSQQSWVDGSGTKYFTAPNIVIESDGKLAGDFPGAELLVPTSGADSFSFETLSSSIGFLNYIPGWTATAASSFPDSWHNNSGYAFWAFGGGSVWYGGVGGQWYEGVDLPITSSATTIYAQPGYDQVQGYPGIGDPWEGGPYSTSSSPTYMPIRATKRMRGRAWGLVFETSGAPFPSALVNTFNASMTSTSYGSGTTNSIGQYKTGTPYGLGNTSIETQLHNSPNPSDTRTWQNRWTFRDSFRGTANAGKALAYDVSLAFRHARASVNESNNHLYLGFSPNGNPYAWVDSDAGFTVGNVRIRWQDNHNGPLGIFYSPSTTSSDGLFVTTPDEGNTFSTPMTITSSLASGGFMDFDETSDFNRWFYWQEGSSAPYTIYMCIVDAQLNVISGPTATNITNSDLAPIAVKEFPVTGGGRSIGFQYTSSGVVKYLTARDGINFS